MILSFLMFTCFAETAAEFRAKKVQEQEKLAAAIEAHEKQSEAILKNMEHEEEAIKQLEEKMKTAGTNITQKEKFLEQAKASLLGLEKQQKSMDPHIKVQAEDVQRQEKSLEELKNQHEQNKTKHGQAKERLAQHTKTFEEHHAKGVAAADKLHHHP